MTAVFHDYSEIDYNDFRLLCGRADEIYAVCGDICKLESELEEQKAQIIRLQTKLDYLKPWLALDIPMSCTRTLKAAVIIGSFKKEISEPEIKAALAQLIPEIEGVEVQIISSSKPITCAVALCHISDSSAVEAALKKIGFARPDNPEKKLVKDASADYEKQIEQAKEKIEEISLQIGGYAESYGDIRFVSDYFLMQKEKYEAVKNAGITEKTIYLSGYVPERSSEELKFELEKRFTAQVELFEPDYEDEDVPVLIENKSFAAGVESISNMYSPPSNSDVDPNPVMAFFYYALFGLMLSDAGYGLLIVIAALVAKFRFKVQGNMKKTADFGLYCGISTVIWGALFGGWFGDLIPTICTAFLGMEKGPVGLVVQPRRPKYGFAFIFVFIRHNPSVRRSCREILYPCQKARFHRSRVRRNSCLCVYFGLCRDRKKLHFSRVATGKDGRYEASCRGCGFDYSDGRQKLEKHSRQARRRLLRPV